MAYFAPIADPQFDKDGSFSVRESRILDFCIGGFCLALYIYAVLQVRSDYSARDWRAYSQSCLIMLCPAVLFIARGVINSTYISVNRKGIFQYRRLVCTWSNFIEANVIEADSQPGYTQDNFVLVIDYYKNPEHTFERRIPLTYTQDKSEEEVIAAINYYFEEYQKRETVPAEKT